MNSTSQSNPTLAAIFGLLATLFISGIAAAFLTIVSFFFQGQQQLDEVVDTPALEAAQP